MSEEKSAYEVVHSQCEVEEHVAREKLDKEHEKLRLNIYKMKMDIARRQQLLAKAEFIYAGGHETDLEPSR